MTREPRNRRPRTLLLHPLAIVSVLATALAACGGPPPGGPGGGGGGAGNLQVIVTGFPPGTAADVAVAGPGGYAQGVTGSTTLSGLAAGTYAVGAEAVSAGVDVGTYDPVEPSQSAVVVADSTTDVTVEYDLHECVAYEPSAAGGDLRGSWTASGSAGDVTRDITVPSDAGGGYVTVRLQSAEGIRPLLGVQVLPLVSGSIFTEATDPVLNPDPTLLEMVFEVAPGRQYQLLLRAASAVSGITFPQGYTASWTFTSRVDCYEPNDTLATAKAIPMENPIQATFIAGYRDSNSIPALSEPTLDFYRFELHAPTAVRITLSDVAATVRPRLTLYTDAGTTIGTGALAPAAGENAVYDSAGALAAGWYRVRVDTQLSPSSFSREAHTSRSNEDVPPHFLLDYTLVVEALD